MNPHQQSHSHSAASGKPVLSQAAANKRRNLIIGLIALCLLAIAAGGFYLWIKFKEPPRFNAPIATLARFITEPAFNELPFDRRELYIQKLDDRNDELEAAWETGKLSDQEYKSALEMAWFAPHLQDMRDYHQIPTQEEKNKMLDRLLDEKKRAKNKTPGANAPKTGASTPAASARPKPKRDEIQEREIPQKWPEADRVRWARFRESLRQRDNERDKAKKAAEKAAKQAATMPAR